MFGIRAQRATCAALWLGIGTASGADAAARGSAAVENGATRLAQAPARELAPELAGIRRWMNSPPLSLGQLKGKVVLLEFWAYSCVNCVRTLPVVQGWHERYRNSGFVVIGVHAPEFPFEGNPENLLAAIKKYQITYPVAMDNDFTTWDRYENRYWPARYLIDRAGRIVETHVGEGGYEETEACIRKELGIAGAGNVDVGPAGVLARRRGGAPAIPAAAGRGLA